MRTLAFDVHQLKGLPPSTINVYLVGDVLVDAGTQVARRRIIRELVGRTPTAHVVTHAHPDHSGSSHAVCEQLAIPLWASTQDADAIEAGRPVTRPTRIGRAMARAKLAGHPVARRLHEGDAVGAGFHVLGARGHTPAHIALWREADRTLIAGDVFLNLPRLGAAPPGFLTYDAARNRESMRRLAELRPELVLFGHGPPLRDPDRLARAAD